MSNYNKEMPEPAQTPRIEIEMVAMTKNTEYLNAVIESLENRLRPILQQVNTDNIGGKMSSVPVLQNLSPLASNLCASNERISELAHRLESILQRLEV